jgi:mannosyltransferase
MNHAIMNNLQRAMKKIAVPYRGGLNVAEPGHGAVQPAPSANKSTTWIWLAALTVLAACLRIIGLNRGLWWDEIYFLVITVRHPLVEILTIFPGDTQHPLYSVLAWLSVHAFGEHAWSLRLPALVFGVASVPLIYYFAAELAGRTEAWLSAALLTVLYHHVWFSQNARGYSMLAFFAMLSTWMLIRGFEGDNSEGNNSKACRFGYALATALGLYSHLTMAFLVASHVAICGCLALFGRPNTLRQRSRGFLMLAFPIAAALSLLFYAPILTQVQQFFMHRPSSMRAVSTPTWAIGEILRGLSLGFGTGAALSAAAVILAFGAWSYFRQSRLIFACLTLPGVFTAAGAFLARGTMYPRFYFYLIGFAALMLVRGMVAIPRWLGARYNSLFSRPMPVQPSALTAVLAVLILGASAFSLLRDYRFPKQDYKSAIDFVNEHKHPGDTVLTGGAAAFPLLNYYSEPWGSFDTVDKLKDVVARQKPVWLIYTFPRYLDAQIPGSTAVIRQGFTIVRVFPGTVGDGDVYVGSLK